MTPYAIRIRQSQGWEKHDAATLGVSVGSPNWQGDKFAAILGFAASHFRAVRIDVTDALYRHSFMAAGHQPDVALARANAAGALWLARHQHIINSVPVKPQVIRWAEWYSHKDYSDVLTGFERAYNVSPVFRGAVQEDIDEFFRRQGREASAREHTGSRDYLIEETAVITLQARELPSLKLYPGSELKCLHVVRAGLIPEAPRGLDQERFARVQFETRRPTMSAGNEAAVPAVG